MEEIRVPSSSLRLVMAFDPGKSVGYSMTDLPARSWFVAGEADINTVAELTTGVLMSLDEPARRESHMIIERFNVAAQPIGSSRTVVVTAEAIGVMRYLAYQYDVPAELKLPVVRNIITKQHLRGLGWYTTGKRNANQATQHLVAWLLDRGYVSVSLE